MIAETLEALNEAREKSGASENEVLFGGIEGELEKLAAAMDAAAPQNGEGKGGSSQEAFEKQQNASRTTEELTVALKQQIDQGLVGVEQDEDKVIITVGAGGAFASGSADLTAEAIAIMQQIAGVNAENDSEITVSGHTDDVPLIFGSRYRDNWDLAAARSASVVQSLSADGIISDERLEAISYGESRPVDSNETADGRSKNRRIEIEINY